MIKAIKFILILLMAGIFSCTSQEKMKKYEWIPSASAPNNYPVEIYKGDFYYEGGSIYIPTGHILGAQKGSGWGVTGPTHVAGEDYKPVPDAFEITWLSYRENQFYTGRFELPKEEMEEHFKKGFTDWRGKQGTYSEINVGMAPGGMVAVWLLAGGKTVEVGRFQAKKTVVTKEEFIPDAEISLDEYVMHTVEEDVADDIKDQPIPFGLWDTYREQYTWHPQMEFQKEETLVNMSMRYYNGESFYTQGSNPEITTDKKRALPKRIQLEWQGQHEQKYGAKVFFEEEEVFEVYRKVFKENKEDQATLVIRVKEDNTEIQLLLKGQQEEIPITKAEIKVYPVSDDW